MVEVVSFFELYPYRRRKSGYKIDKLSPKAPDSYKLDNTGSILGSNYGQVIFVNYNPVELLLCYKPTSVLYEVLRRDGLRAN